MIVLGVLRCNNRSIGVLESTSTTCMRGLVLVSHLLPGTSSSCKGNWGGGLAAVSGSDLQTGSTMSVSIGNFFRGIRYPGINGMGVIPVSLSSTAFTLDFGTVVHLASTFTLLWLILTGNS